MEDFFALIGYASQMSGLNRDITEIAEELEGVLEGIDELSDGATHLCFSFSDEIYGEMFCRRIAELLEALELDGSVMLTNDPAVFMEIEEDEDDGEED